MDTFLLGGAGNHPPNLTLDFYQRDSSDLFKKNLSTQPIDWHYRLKAIKYKFNSLKYRTIEFDQVDWKNSVVMFGCSNVFGQGLAEDETIPAQLSMILGRPVINMGVVASSNMFSFQNSLILHDNFPTPWGISHVWTSSDRVNYFTKNKPDSVVHCGTWAPTNSFYRAWNEPESNAEIHTEFIFKASRAVWKNKTRYSTSSYWDYDGVAKLNYLDYARDMMHPGYLSSIESAKIIAEQLTKN